MYFEKEKDREKTERENDKTKNLFFDSLLERAIDRSLWRATTKRSNRRITAKATTTDVRARGWARFDIIESEWRARNARKRRGPGNYPGARTSAIPNSLCP